MGDEKARAQGDEKKPETPPPTTVKAPAPEQHGGPGREKEKHPKAPDTTGTQKQQAESAAGLQQSVGNQQTNRLLRAARDSAGPPGLPVSHPDDKAEKEAEAVAKKVTEEHPPHPRDHPAPAHGDPTAIHGDPHEVTGDPEQQRQTVHRAVRDRANTPAPHGPEAPHGPAGGADHTSPTAILNHPGPGAPIPQPTRSTLERKLNADLRHVVVHHDAQADTAVRALHARAVTKGNHIWLASDASPNDLQLMAHEVAHVLQHHNHTVHRQTEGTPPSSDSSEYRGPEGSVNTKSSPKRIDVPEILYSSDKDKSGVKISKQDVRVTPRGKPRQVEKWKAGIGRGGIQTEVQEKIKKKTAYLPPPVPPDAAAPPGPPADAKYILEYSPGKGKNHQGVLIGTVDEITKAASVPQWDKSGEYHTFDVDHVQELQISGQDDISNYWLWDSVANQSAGNALNTEINNRLEPLLTAARGKLGTGVPGSAEAARKDQRNWYINIKKISGGLKGVAGSPGIFWTRQEIEKGESAKVLKTVKPKRAEELGLYPTGSSDYLTILTLAGKSGAGQTGALVRIPWKEGQKKAEGKLLDKVFGSFFPYVKIIEVSYDEEKRSGVLRATAHDKKNLSDIKELKPLKLTGFGDSSQRMATLAGYGLAQEAGFWNLKAMSPIEVAEAELRPYTGLYLRGVLKPTIPLLKGAEIAIVLDGGDIFLEATFAADEIQAPKPIKITNGSLTVSIGTKGLAGSGSVSLELAPIAKGSLQLAFSSAGEFGLNGSLDFDTKLFDPAKLGFQYQRKGKDYQWGVSGELGIGPKQVPGIKSARIKASYQDNQFAASGDAQLSVPGLESGTLDIKYGEREGVSIGGAFQLSKDVPGIQSGEVSATVAKKPPGNQWQLSAHGTAKPKIPGVDATLQASYEDGVFTVEGQAAYARGMLSGSIQVGVTNRPINPQGEPGGKPAPNAPLRLYGGGQLTLKLAPWLQATAGVKLEQDGSVSLTGKVGLPDAINLFDAKEIKKNIATIGLDIPIVGISVLGQRIGIFATIQGGLEAEAGVGPGQLRQLGLEVQYNPAHEDQTSITGTAQLHIPAHAGLRLFVRGALGAGIPLVSAEAGLEVGGKLGVEGAVQASVQVNWTPKKGLVIDAVAALSAEPKFTFDINGYVKVEVDTFVFSATLYEKHWQLAAFEYGSGLRIGVRAPVHYEQGKPFDFNLSDVQFELPKVDPGQILKDLVKRIA